MTNSLLISMLKMEMMKSLGVRQQIAQQFFAMMEISITIDVLYAKDIIVSIVDATFISTKLVHNIESIIPSVKMIRNFRILSKGPNLNNVPSVNFGFKDLQVATRWSVVVEINFVMNVEAVVVLMVVAKTLDAMLAQMLCLAIIEIEDDLSIFINNLILLKIKTRTKYQ